MERAFQRPVFMTHLLKNREVVWASVVDESVVQIQQSMH